MKNFFRNVFIFVACFVGTVFFSSCPDPDPVLNVSGTAISISATGTVLGDITVTTEHTDWAVKIMQGSEWLIAYTNGNKLGLDAKENTTKDARIALVKIYATANEQLSQVVTVTQTGADISLKVSQSVELLGEEKSKTTITISVSPATTSWRLSSAKPEWLSFNESGIGSSTVELTATQENFSDEVRSATLVFTTSDGTSSASCIVNQKGLLPSYRVEMTDVTVMSDGFAGDLKFSSGCKGYKEAYYFASAFPAATPRDVYNALMSEQEWEGSLDYFASPYCSPDYYPQADLVYCIAAYGSESNADGSHKYGPVCMVRVKTKPLTRSSDMYLTFSATTSNWKVITSRQGQFGQKCDEYYCIAGDGEVAEYLYDRWIAVNLSEAYFTHFFFKPAIKKNPDAYYLNGPQTLNFNRDADKFCCITWGTNKDTHEFSSELIGLWYPNDFYPEKATKRSSKLQFNNTGSIAFKRDCQFKKDMPKLKVGVFKK